MDRKDFLKSSLAFCGLALIPFALTESCSKQDFSGPSNVNFTLDLTSSANAALNTVGGYIVSNGVLVIRYSATAFDALSATCTHAGCSLGYSASSAKVACPCHGGMYDPNTGDVVSGPPPSGLKKYAITQIGSTLTVKS